MSLSSLNQDEVRQIVRETVHETLTTIGLDVSEPAAIIEAQKDLAFTRDLRLATRKARDVGIRAAMLTTVAGICSALWIGFKSKVGGP